MSGTWEVSPHQETAARAGCEAHRSNARAHACGTAGNSVRAGAVVRRLDANRRSGTRAGGNVMRTQRQSPRQQAQTANKQWHACA
eukprot:4864317-Prymnesium_polylepis.1